MKIINDCTGNLGDFLNGMPVLSGISKFEGKFDLLLRPDMKRFKGIKEFLEYQDLFSSVNFLDEIFLYNSEIIRFSSWTREDKNSPTRPTETCRYENWMRDNYQFKFDVDDDFVIKYPKLDISVPERLVGDRWNVGDIDNRREYNVLSYLNDKFEFVDYNNDILTNCFLISESKNTFITNLTGVAILADLLCKDTFIVWKAEDWKPEFRRGNDVSWDNGKNIQQIYEKHFYSNRNCRMIHSNELKFHI